MSTKHLLLSSVPDAPPARRPVSPDQAAPHQRLRHLHLGDAARAQRTVRRKSFHDVFKFHSVNVNCSVFSVVFRYTVVQVSVDLLAPV